MKYVFIVSLNLLILIIGAGCAEKKQDFSGLVKETAQEALIQGNKDLEHTLYTSLTIQGKGNLEDVTVENMLTVQGNLEAKDCSFHNVMIQGRADIEETRVSGVLQVLGFAEFEECSLQKVEVSGDKVVFDDCTISTIYMKKNADKKQFVILDDTQVAGNIVFEQEGGHIEMKGSSEIHGKVIGGHIIK